MTSTTPEQQTFELFTCNYTRFRSAMGTPVQTSNGKPRYALKYDLELACREVFPPWKIVRGHLPKPEFRAAYFEHLEGHGVDKIASRFRALAVAGGDPRLVLLCFEAIEKSPDNWCHRTMFAEWWTQQTGDQVRELGPAGAGAEPMLF